MDEFFTSAWRLPYNKIEPEIEKAKERFTKMDRRDQARLAQKLMAKSSQGEWLTHEERCILSRWRYIQKCKTRRFNDFRRTRNNRVLKALPVYRGTNNA